MKNRLKSFSAGILIKLSGIKMILLHNFPIRFLKCFFLFIHSKSYLLGFNKGTKIMLMSQRLQEDNKDYVSRQNVAKK